MASPPISAEEYFYTGTHLLGEGELVAAATAFRYALTLAPNMAEAHANLAWLSEQNGQALEAEEHYRRALTHNPLQHQTLINFGAFLTALKRFDEAEAVYQHARQVAPESVGVLSNLGMLLASLQREEEAEASYRTAIALEPTYRKARFNLAYLLLRQGRYKEGWACMEARESTSAAAKHLPFPRWQGEALGGKSLLIVVEGGFGDTIQFCRYAALAKKNGAAHVAVLCQPELTRLLSNMPSIDDVIGYDESLPNTAWDYWTMSLSLPFLFDTTLDTIPATLPYLFAETESVQHWKQVVDDGRANLRIGIAWQGNPHFENDADRSLASPALLAPLDAIPHTRYFSLQKQRDEKINTTASLSFCDLTSHMHDFADTAAIMMNLDLVITVDTAVAHLAGALGKPCWVLLPAYKPDWRWLASRDDSPWYPHVMRLFRQQHAGDWAPVIQQLISALRLLTKQQYENDNNE